MRSWPGEEDHPPLLLTVLPTQELWVWTLTDGAGLARVASSIPALAQAEAIAVQFERGGGGPAAAARLGHLLFPGDIGECLAQAAPGALTLQIHPSMDRLDWELAWAGNAPLGQRFKVSRQPVLDEDLPITSSAAVARSSSLRVLRVLPAGSAADADVFEGVTRLGPDDGASWSTYNLVLLPRADSDGWARLPVPKQFVTWNATLMVATVADPASALTAARIAVRYGAALLLTLHDGREPLPSWWPSLVRQLSDGLAPAAAVRQIRRDHAAARPSPVLRLYGQAGGPLCHPSDGRNFAQRRQVTALSVDVVGSTHMLHELGAERYSSLLHAFHDLCADVMHRHGGVADDPQGDDGLMSYFGYPVAGEDAAPRAVLAGLKLVQAVVGLGLEVRVGVATGPVAIQNDTPVGVAIHLAARLQQLARPGSVLLADSTRALLGPEFELAPLAAPLELKGIEGAQAAWLAMGWRNEAPTGMLAGSPLTVPLIGREAEIEALWSRWQKARQGCLQVVVVQGEAGIGKTRLLRELRARLAAEGVESALCRCLPDARSSAFFALGMTFRRMLDIKDSDPLDVQLAQMEERMPPTISRVDAVPLAAGLLSIPLQGPAATSPPERWREKTLEMLLRWFESAAQKSPICLMVEDTHWVDPSTREFLHRLLPRVKSLPVLVVASQRTDDMTGWEPSIAHERIWLRGLSPSAARWLVRQTCGNEPLPADVVRLLAARADGVPLFLEESVRMAMDVYQDEPAARGQLAALVPTRLQDLLMARVDRLAEARPVAQLAATIGRAFPWALLQAVVAQEFGVAGAGNLEARVQALERAGLVVRSGEGEQLRLSFRHALLRDTAYQSLWQRDRRRLHQVVAGVLTASFAALVQRQPEMLAYHLAEAGQHDAALAQWEAAARLAIARSANDEAIAHLDAALDSLGRLPAGTARDRIELRLQTLLAARCIAAEGYGAKRVERVYARASALCEQLADRRALMKVELGLHAWSFMHADFQRANEIARRALAAAVETSAEPMARIQARWSVGITLWHQGELTPAVRLMDECFFEYQPKWHRAGAVQDPGVMCGCYSAWGLWELGHVDEALVRMQRVLALAHELEHPFSLGIVLGFASSVHHFRGDTGPALEAAQRAVEVCDEGGYTTWLAHARMMRGRLYCESGRIDEGLAEMNDAYASWVASGAQVTRPLYLTMQAEGLALAGRSAEGLRLLHEARVMAERTGERYHEAEIRRMLGDLTVVAEGASGVSEARDWLASATSLAQSQGKLSFVLRSGLSQARLSADPKCAADTLRAALAAVHGGQGTRDVDAARAWLEEHGVEASA